MVAGSGQPARRARVSLSGGADVGGSRSMLTDDSGRFSFTLLPAGRFNLSASKQGYVNVSYGQRRPGPGRPGTPIQLADGQKMQVQLQLPRGGVITGTVLDEHGEAVPGTPVRVMRWALQSGQRTLQSGGNAQTDDRGVYRVYGLQPGDYIVYATPRNNVASVDVEMREMAVRSLVADRVAMADVAVPSQEARVAIERAMQEARTAPPTPTNDEPIAGYAPVYYPGTTAPASAVTITVGPGEEKSNVDFQYQVVPVARVEGVVISPQSLQNIQVTLVNTGHNVPGISPGSARADAQGAFRISNVPPGQYAVIARATINQGREGGPGRGGQAPAAAGRGRGMEITPMRMAPPEPVRLWAMAEVTVDGRNIQNVVLTLQPGTTIAGRIAFEGTATVPTDLARLRVNVSPVVMPGTPGELASSSAGRVDSSGRFTISSVVPGKYRLSASGAGNQWFLGSSVIEGHDTLDFPVDVKSQGVNGAVITFVDRQTELTGTIVDDQSKPASDYTLIVYSADPRYWTGQSRRIQSTRPATDGRYTFRNLPAGEYRIAPVLDPEPGSWYDPAFLQQLDNTALRVPIADGEKKEQNLRVPGGG